MTVLLRSRKPKHTIVRLRSAQKARAARIAVATMRFLAGYAKSKGRR